MKNHFVLRLLGYTSNGVGGGIVVVYNSLHTHIVRGHKAVILSRVHHMAINVGLSSQLRAEFAYSIVNSISTYLGDWFHFISLYFSSPYHGHIWGHPIQHTGINYCCLFLCSEQQTHIFLIVQPISGGVLCGYHVLRYDMSDAYKEKHIFSSRKTEYVEHTS